MKIGILTLPLWNNYGGILQAWALKNFLNSHNIETLLIDFHHNPPTKLESIKRKFKNFIKTKVFGKNNFSYPNLRQKEYISKSTLSFIRNEVSELSSKIYTIDELVRCTEHLDGVVVGSDQVWRPSYTPEIKRYFLDFVDSEKIKISYAASFGTDDWLFSDIETNTCKELLQSFDLITVRETSGIKLVKDKFNLSAKQVLDPTLLIPKYKYIELIERYDAPKSKGDLFAYILDRNDSTDSFLSKINKRYGFIPFMVMPKTFDDSFSFSNDKYVFPCVTQWIKSFADAQYVVADSFHGCVFAIIFNKPFIALGNVDRGLTRFESLLRLFNLEDRLVLDIESFDYSLFDKEIDWKTVNLKLDELRHISTSLLLNTLESKND